MNSSNTKLILGDGVSKMFKIHCGLELQKEMDKVLNSIDGEFEQGELAVTSSSQAENFKYAMHIMTMNYNRGVRSQKRKPTLETIKKSLQNIEKYLYLYANNKPKPIKVVIPIMGCGAGGLDKKEVIELYREFFSRKVDLVCELVIYGYDLEDYSLLIDSFEKNKCTKNV